MPRGRRQHAADGKEYRGSHAQAGGQTLQSWTVGALPLINSLLERIKLEFFFQKHLPPDDPRLEVPTACGLLLLVRNILLSREPIYGMGEWAARYAPDLLGLTSDQLSGLNDDRIGRCLDRLFDSEVPALVLDVVRHVVHEFHVSLDELHNDSTTVSFYGAYEEASQEDRRRGRPTLAITHGYNKDHRPDLKQLLYILTVTDDGGVPVYFTSASGNVADDTTHRETWQLLRQLVGRPDFLYVADCKLASTENLQFIHHRRGRFVTVLPRTRREDAQFRRRLVSSPDAIPWQEVYDVTDGQGEVVDRLRVCRDSGSSSEGFRLLWFHSTGKALRDASRRARAIERASNELVRLRNRLLSPKTRFHQRASVLEAVEDILQSCEAKRWVDVEIDECEFTDYRQTTRGRPTKTTKYVKRVSTRFSLTFQINTAHVAEDRVSDGVFPLVTNDLEMTAEQLLRAYKRQPLIEKRFSQFKTDFEVAPVYLKSVSRIQSLLCVYFFVLMIQTLLERELRHALAQSDTTSLPLYPEGRSCRAPTTRRVLDVFNTVQRHRLSRGENAETFITELTPVQRQILQLLRVNASHYGRSTGCPTTKSQEIEAETCGK